MEKGRPGVPGKGLRCPSMRTAPLPLGASGPVLTALCGSSGVARYLHFHQSGKMCSKGGSSCVTGN